MVSKARNQRGDRLKYVTRGIIQYFIILNARSEKTEDIVSPELFDIHFITRYYPAQDNIRLLELLLDYTLKYGDVIQFCMKIMTCLFIFYK